MNLETCISRRAAYMPCLSLAIRAVVVLLSGHAAVSTTTREWVYIPDYNKLQSVAGCAVQPSGIATLLWPIAFILKYILWFRGALHPLSAVALSGCWGSNEGFGVPLGLWAAAKAWSLSGLKSSCAEKMNLILLLFSSFVWKHIASFHLINVVRLLLLFCDSFEGVTRLAEYNRALFHSLIRLLSQAHSPSFARI